MEWALADLNKNHVGALQYVPILLYIFMQAVEDTLQIDFSVFFFPLLQTFVLIKLIQLSS